MKKTHAEHSSSEAANLSGVPRREWIEGALGLGAVAALSGRAALGESARSDLVIRESQKPGAGGCCRTRCPLPNNQPFPLMLPSMNRLQSQPLHAGPLRTGLVFGQLLARCLGLAWLALLAASPGAHAAPVRLENDHVAVEVDVATGGLLSLHDKELQATYRMSGLGYRLETDRGTVTSSQLRLGDHSPTALTLTTAAGGFAVSLHYRLGANDRFIEKWLEVKYPDAAPWTLQRVVLEDVTFDPGFREIHFHDDQTPWHSPINFFLRSDRGGCYAGLEYPYWDYEVRGASGLRLGYEPNYPVAAGEKFVSEKFFLGTYRYEGIYRYAHGPFPGPAKPAYLTFNNASVSHFGDTKDVPPEVLDWGEVWAMQAFMRHVLPPHKLPEDGYWAWVNAWWHWAYTWKQLTKDDLDLLRESGIHDAMTQEMWFGHSQHPLMAKYVADFDPAKPLDFRAAKPIEDLYAYGRKIGVNVTSFSSPPISFTQRPEWLSSKKDGSPITYIQGVKASCPASDDYMNYLQSLYLHIFERYQVRWWGFDGRWTSFREVPYGDGPGIEPDPCFAAHHGHPPGDNRYREFRNITRLLAELRRQHPRICLETYYGLKRVENWVARDLNATENYYESNGSDIDRFQQWHNQNGRFLPPDRNYSAVFGRTPEAFRHSFIACLAGGPYCQVGGGLSQLRDPATRAFFKKWREWGSRHHEFLQVKRDLFGTFGYAPLDGSAHLLKDRGFLFLFPTGLQPNTHTPANDEGIEASVRQRTTQLRAGIRLNHWLGLEEDRQLRLRITEVYPRENRPLGIHRYGQEFLYDLPANSAVILEVRPATADETAPDQAFDAALPASRVRIVQAFEEGVLTIREFLGMSNAEHANVFLKSGRLETASGNWNLVDGVARERFEAGAVNQFASQAVDLQDLRLNAPATVAVWIRLPETPKDLRILSQLAGSTGQAGALRLEDAQLQVWNGKAWQTAIPDGVKPDTWLHVAITFKPDGTATGFLNGVEQKTVPSGFDFLGVRAGIGAKAMRQHGQEFVGQMRDFRINRRVLSTDEIARLAKSTAL